MKNVLLFISTLLFITGLQNVNAKIYAYEKIENVNNVKFTYDNYNKLKSMGYSDQSIKFLNVEEYKKVENIRIVSTIQTEEYYYEDVEKYPPQLFINPNINIDNDSGASGSQHCDVSESIETNATRKLTLTATYYYDEGNGARFNIRMEVEWLTIPDILERDYITIIKPDQLDYAIRKIGNTQYIDFNSGISNGVSSYQVNPLDTESYKLADGGIVVQLPAISKQNIYQLNCYMSCNFIPNNKNISSVFCQGSHLHKKKKFNLDWNGVTLSTTPPFIELSITGSRKEKYDSISAYASLENISL